MSQPAPNESSDETPRVGRPRDPRVDDAIRQATLELLVEDGYQATTIQAIARRAGVSAPSVYRRWSSKAELIEEAVFPSGLLAPEARTGDVITDLAPYCLQILNYLADPAIRAAIPGLLVEYQNHREIWQHSMQRSFFPMRKSFEAYLAQTGRQPTVSSDALFDVMVGALFTRALNEGSDGAAEFARAVAEIVTAALRSPTGTPRSPAKKGA
ncbi:MAG TPA: TetR/AcrR family transcriptional regulator [Mycobacteriales bacterium]|jgi:AcrR family transcriptional regulator|nr:TetR/AcrR family transcriptional regulator [Mycobacteriales bacterium]HVX70997.1 TetR/AcrR family transcriptional regulator [Mycobacteriales bacterium]